MATPQQQQVIKQWLDRVLGPYPSSDIVSREALAALAKFPTLAVKTDAYTYDSGQTNLLLQLHGTIPISYRSATYHIPLVIWFPLEYPRRPPLVYVTPTRDMAIRKSAEVEPGGRVGGEMMGNWERKWEGNSLAALVSWMQDLFSTQPPVYARPPQPPSTPPPTQSSSSSRPATPSQLQYQPQNQARASPPPRPALLPQLQGRGYPQHGGGHGRSGSGSEIGGGAEGYGNAIAGPSRQEQLPAYKPAPAPPLPQSPLRQPSLPPQSQPNGQPPQAEGPPPRPGPPTIAGRPASGFGYNGGGGPGFVPPVQSASAVPFQQGGQGVHQQQFQQGGYNPAGGPISPGPIRQISNPPYNGHGPPPPIPSQHPTPTHTPGPGSQGQYNPQGQQQPQQPQPRAAPRPPVLDLMSDESDILPPSPTSGRPGPTPNLGTSTPPIKPLPPSTLHLHSLLHQHLSTRLDPLLTQLHSQTTRLLSVRADLDSGEPAIRDEMARLEAVKGVCLSVGERVGDVVRRGEGRVRELEGKGEVGVDEVVCSVSIVHNQLIDLMAEDNAIEDTIYHLSRALDAERIDLNSFLKQLRILGREQYMRRALIEKIQVELRKGRG